MRDAQRWGLTAEQRSRVRAHIAEQIEAQGWDYPDYSSDDQPDFTDDNGSDGYEGA